MDLSNFVTYDKKEPLLLNIPKSNHEFVEDTHSKPQQTLEFRTTKQKEPFSFDVALEVNVKWMMGVTSLEIYNIVYNIAAENNKLQFLLTDEQFEELGVATQLLKIAEYLCRTVEDDKKYIEFVEQANAFEIDSYFNNRMPTRKKFFL